MQRKEHFPIRAQEKQGLLGFLAQHRLDLRPVGMSGSFQICGFQLWTTWRPALWGVALLTGQPQGKSPITRAHAQTVAHPKFADMHIRTLTSGHMHNIHRHTHTRAHAQTVRHATFPDAHTHTHTNKQSHTRHSVTSKHTHTHTQTVTHNINTQTYNPEHSKIQRK